MISLFLLAWEVVCAALFWSIFCRSVRADKTTRLDIRLALWLVGIASLMGLGAPLYGWLPNLVTLMIVGSVVILQVVMSKHWNDGVPIQFIDPKYRPRRRVMDRQEQKPISRARHPSVPEGLSLALYKGTRTGLGGISNRIGRYLDRGAYSHCELVLSSGLSASSSIADGGVRIKHIGYSSEGAWDFLVIPDPDGALETAAVRWFMEHDGQGYDLLGNLRFATGFARDSGGKWFCSEACMAALGLPEPYRYGPSGAAALLQWHFGADLVEVITSWGDL